MATARVHRGSRQCGGVALGLSVYEPDPLAAIERAEAEADPEPVA